MSAGRPVCAGAVRLHWAWRGGGMSCSISSSVKTAELFASTNALTNAALRSKYSASASKPIRCRPAKDWLRPVCSAPPLDKLTERLLVPCFAETACPVPSERKGWRKTRFQAPCATLSCSVLSVSSGGNGSECAMPSVCDAAPRGPPRPGSARSARTAPRYPPRGRFRPPR